MGVWHFGEGVTACLPREISADKHVPESSFSGTHLAGAAHLTGRGPHQLHKNVRTSWTEPTAAFGPGGLLVVPAYNVDRWRCLCMSHSGIGNLSPPQTRLLWRLKRSWSQQQKYGCSSRRDWEMRSSEPQAQSHMLMLFHLQVPPTSHSTPTTITLLLLLLDCNRDYENTIFSRITISIVHFKPHICLWFMTLKYFLDSEILWVGEREEGRSPRKYWHFISTLKRKGNDDIITSTEGALVNLCLRKKHQIFTNPRAFLTFISKALWYATSALLVGFQSGITCNTRIWMLDDYPRPIFPHYCLIS